MFGLLARGGANLDWSHGHFVPSLVLDRNFHLPLSISRRTHQLSSSVRAIADNPASTSVPRLHRMSRDLANLPQFLVGVMHLFFISRAFQVAQSRFFRNAAQFSFRYAEQEGGSGLGHEFWYLIRQIVHGFPTICTPALGVVDGSRLNRLLVFGAARQTFLPLTLRG